jgi:methylenetetrahydrofolate reductase (NADPH)
MSLSNLQERLQSGAFVITSEIGPPKGTNVEPCLREAEEHLKNTCTSVNVTDNQSSVMRFGSMATCRLLLDRGIEPVLQMVCRDRNSIALQSDAISAYGLGIRNVLAITGDHQTLGDHPQATGVFDLDSVGLLQALCELESGRDLSGNGLDGRPEFCKGAVVTPCVDPVEPQIIKMEKKVRAGAQFFQTQAVFETARFADFMEKTRHLGVPVLAGIVFLKSVGMAKFMNSNVAGVHVPDELIHELAGVEKERRVEKSIEIAARLTGELKGLCQGIHVMSLGWERYVPTVLEKAGLL